MIMIRIRLLHNYGPCTFLSKSLKPELDLSPNAVSSEWDHS